MSVNIVFYAVFFSQIILISYYYPRKLLRRMTTVLETYPPSQYPKLYPKTIEAEQKAQRNYRFMNLGILVVGFVLMALYAMLSPEYDAKQKHAEGLPIFYGMLQFLPFLLCELSGFKQLKLMREANSRTTRKAALQPRNFFGFVSPLLVGLAVFMFVAYIVIEFYLPQLQLQWDIDGIFRAVTLVVCNLLFAGIIIWNLKGKKQDPHQAHKDRLRQIGYIVKSLVLISIAASMYFILTVATEKFALEYLEVIFNSLYFQLLAVIAIGTMLRSLRIEDIDFDVYKEDASVA